MRVATWAGDFSRKGPGLMLRDLLNAPEDAGLAPILAARPDILLLTDIDHDAGLATLGALRDALRARGLDYPVAFSARPNTGMATGRDLDGDGRLGGPGDAQGFGWFSGQGGLAILSRHPVALVQNRSAMLWQDVPGSRIAGDDPGLGVQRLASSAFWQIAVTLPEGSLTLLALGATPPVFDGPEDRNGRRNADEVTFWTHLLDGRLGDAPAMPVVLLGNLNLDPQRGDGLRDAARAVLEHPRLHDPLPGTPTVTWDSTGPMRVSYVLPDAALRVLDAGVTPPDPDAGPHGLVWVDVALP